MTEQVYRDLLEVMKSRRGAYGGMDIPEFFVAAFLSTSLTALPTVFASTSSKQLLSGGQISY